MAARSRQDGAQPFTGDKDPHDIMDKRTLEQITAARRASFSFVKAAFAQVYRSQNRKLSKQGLDVLKIKCYDLDIKNGAGSDGGPVFISPMPREELNRLLTENEPWLHREFPNKKDSHKMCAGLQIGDFLETWMDFSGHPHPNDNGMIWSTPWRERLAKPELEVYESLYKKEDGAYWQSRFILDQNRPDVPHIACFVADQAEMSDDSLLMSEMHCALGLMAGRLRMTTHYQHRIAPVTVVSASDRRLRVLQVYFDNVHQTIIVRKSRILSFEKDNLENTRLILAWLLGTAVGETRFKACQGVQTAELPVRSNLQPAPEISKKKSWFK